MLICKQWFHAILTAILRQKKPCKGGMKPDNHPCY